MPEFLGALLWLASGLAIVWAAWRLGTRNARKAKLEREERMTHIVGDSRRWWKEAPGDGPEGDH